VSALDFMPESRLLYLKKGDEYFPATDQFYDYLPFNPLIIEDCMMWHDANDAESITADETGRVSKWENIANGGTFDMLQQFEVFEPQFLTEDNKRFIRFQGNEYLETINEFNASNPDFTVFVVTKRNDITDENQYLSINANAFIRFVSATQRLRVSIVNSIFTGTAADTNTGIRYYASRFDSAAGTINLYQNGAADVQGTGKVFDSPNGLLKFNRTTLGLTGNSDIYESIFYNRALTPTEISTVNSYLVAKWGIV